MKNWRQTLLPPSATIQDAISSLDHTSMGIALVVDDTNTLLGTITDGDIRRGLLKGLTMMNSVSEILNNNPIVVPPGLSLDLIRKMMKANEVLQIPEVDEHHIVLNLHTWLEETSVSHNNFLMVIMAGGQGKRLRPFTNDIPKPMLEVRGKPMLEHIIDRAKNEGFRKFLISINYLGEVIEEYFDDGSRLGVSIRYLREVDPLGTAGALSLIEPIPELPFVVTNGDVITDIRYMDLLDFHIRHMSEATMVVRMHEWQHPFGVVQLSGLDIVGFEEKPIVRSHINAGIYVLSPNAITILSPNDFCDMPTLFQKMQSKNLRTIAYPMYEPWLDVGRPEDLNQANATIYSEN